MRPIQFLFAAFTLIAFASCKKIEQPVLPVIRLDYVGSISSGVDIYSSSHVAFFDANNGVIAGYNHFSVTHDGGKTWTSPITFPANTEFVGLSIVGTSCYAFQNGNPAGKIYRSSDNGATWQVVSNTPVGLIGYFLTPSLAYKTVWLGSEYGIERTIDGGQTWTNVNLPVPNSQFQLQHFYFTDENTGYVVSHINNRMYTTSNGGATWTSRPTGDETVKVEVLGNRIFHAHSSYNEDRITYTDNNGQSWNPVVFDSRFNSYGDDAENISFSADGTIGCASGNNNLVYLSTDRGHTWQYQLSENGTMQFEDDEISIENIKIIPGNKILVFTRDEKVYELIWQK